MTARIKHSETAQIKIARQLCSHRLHLQWEWEWDIVPRPSGAKMRIAGAVLSSISPDIGFDRGALSWMFPFLH